MNGARGGSTHETVCSYAETDRPALECHEHFGISGNPGKGGGGRDNQMAVLSADTDVRVYPLCRARSYGTSYFESQLCCYCRRVNYLTLHVYLLLKPFARDEWQIIVLVVAFHLASIALTDFLTQSKGSRMYDVTCPPRHHSMQTTTMRRLDTARRCSVKSGSLGGDHFLERFVELAVDRTNVFRHLGHSLEKRALSYTRCTGDNHSRPPTAPKRLPKLRAGDNLEASRRRWAKHFSAGREIPCFGGV